MILKATAHKDQEVEKYYLETLEKISKFFEVEGFKPPNLILLENRKAINIAWGKETASWVVGWYSGRAIYLLCPENYSAESSHTYSNEEYKRLIEHEVIHFFYKALVGSNRPLWLGEGLSVYLSEQYKEKTKPKEFEHFLKFYNQRDKNIYTESGHAIKLLIDRFGEEKLISFVKSLWKHKSPQDVETKFQETFGLPLSFDTFNKL